MVLDMVDLRSVAFVDVERELTVTRKVLAAVPMDMADWKPHEKSMTLGKQAIELAYYPEWLRMTLDQDVMEMEKTETKGPFPSLSSVASCSPFIRANSPPQKAVKLFFKKKCRTKCSESRRMSDTVGHISLQTEIQPVFPKTGCIVGQRRKRLSSFPPGGK